ncbi:hypothetical protein EJ06DRAFT_271667 [Trichodelitschia bisporula]|uniref:Uncharacterized protein n=1 Tax=Trichodelitschia bisporula TaxID=703511 RepID=A0A6G1I544_9PEZI|nr:hypothetical protein EJ06DRAFT_271667 [Trichodelitschia bisporula]
MQAAHTPKNNSTNGGRRSSETRWIPAAGSCEGCFSASTAVAFVARRAVDGCLLDGSFACGHSEWRTLRDAGCCPNDGPPNCEGNFTIGLNMGEATLVALHLSRYFCLLSPAAARREGISMQGREVGMRIVRTYFERCQYIGVQRLVMQPLDGMLKVYLRTVRKGGKGSRWLESALTSVSCFPAVRWTPEAVMRFGLVASLISL